MNKSTFENDLFMMYNPLCKQN